MNEKIKRLLDSDNEEDNEIGWELVTAEKVPFCEVMDYVEKTKVPTNWVQKYRWDGKKYVRNDKDYDKKILSEYMNYPTSFIADGTYTGTDLINKYNNR